jgi:hypothetical protein
MSPGWNASADDEISGGPGFSETESKPFIFANLTLIKTHILFTLARIRVD